MSTATHSEIFKMQIKSLEELLVNLIAVASLQEKIKVLKSYLEKKALSGFEDLFQPISLLNPKYELILLSLIAIGQSNIIGASVSKNQDPKQALENIVQSLLDVEHFYEFMGGIVGYHLSFLKLLSDMERSSHLREDVNFSPPPLYDFTSYDPKIRQAVRWGIEMLGDLAEFYPVGGAGDRLNLLDETTKEPLPVAQLVFRGHTLLEGLIRDLQGKEYLHYKLTGQQLNTPVSIMTSHEKHNHQRIEAICKSKRWFGRNPESFRLFLQPLVPMITEDGIWAINSKGLILKPGGHGVLWKLALDEGIFDWLHSLNKTKVLVRQINNPMAGRGYTSLAFTGIGCHDNKEFGFVCCPRIPNVPEGMLVLVEEEKQKESVYWIKNIEYTESEQQAIKNRIFRGGLEYTSFPANTNILFADLDAIKRGCSLSPLPGMMINMKKKVSHFSENGYEIESPAGRLESMMQNIAEGIQEIKSEKILPGQRQAMGSYLLYLPREKVISVTKEAYSPTKSIKGTPEGCFYDQLKDDFELLSERCGVDLPTLDSEDEYLTNGPNLIFQYHPALGPLHSVIAQKIRGGIIHERSELILEISEVDMENLDLEGSLIVTAQNVMGKCDESGLIQYGLESGKCTLQNVKVKNQGIERKVENIYWKGQYNRKESVNIILNGHSEFIAQDVVFKGPHQINVPKGKRVIASMNGEQIEFRTETIFAEGWHWEYEFDSEDNIKLAKRNARNV